MWNVSENYLPAKHAAIFQSVPSPSPSSSHSAVRISAIAKRPTQNCSLNSRLASESIDRVLQNRKGEPSPTCLPHDCDVVGTGSGDTRGPRDGYMGEEGRPAEALKDRRPVEESRFSRNFKDDVSRAPLKRKMRIRQVLARRKVSTPVTLALTPWPFNTGKESTLEVRDLI